MKGRVKPMWTAKTNNVDADTGEIIPKQLTKYYYKLNTTKHVKSNSNHTGGYIEYTNLWKRKPEQRKLF